MVGVARATRPAALSGAVVAALAFAACNSSGEDSRNHRLALWDAVSGDWRFISPAGRSSHEFEWLPDGSAMLVIEGESQGPGQARSGGYFLAVRELSGKVRWEVEGGMDDRQPVAATGSPDSTEVAVLRDTFGDGERTAFIEIRDAGSGQVLRSTETWITRLTSGAAPVAADIVWTPDGRLAVVSHRGAGFNDLLWFDAGSMAAEPLRPTEASEVWAIGNAMNPKVLVFALSQPGGGSTLTLHEPGGPARDIDVGLGGNLAVDFSPDGTRLVVAYDEGIETIDLRSGERHILRGAFTYGISWGANRRIASAWGSDVITFDEDGSGLQTEVSLSGGRTARHPAWSPDGESIAFIVEPRYRD